MVGTLVSLTAAVVERPLRYKAAWSFAGWHAYDDAATGRRPGVPSIHRWTGISDHEKEAARKPVGLGCNVLVADIYRKDVRP